MHIIIIILLLCLHILYSYHLLQGVQSIKSIQDKVLKCSEEQQVHIDRCNHSGLLHNKKAALQFCASYKHTLVSYGACSAQSELPTTCQVLAQGMFCAALPVYSVLAIPFYFSCMQCQHWISLTLSWVVIEQHNINLTFPSRTWLNIFSSTAQMPASGTIFITVKSWAGQLMHVRTHLPGCLLVMC